MCFPWLRIQREVVFHENGDYAQERTLILSMTDVEEAIAAEIAKDSSIFFHQKSGLLTASEIKADCINERLRVHKKQRSLQAVLSITYTAIDSADLLEKLTCSFGV